MRAVAIPALATTDPNWLLTAHPDHYLFGSLVEAEMFGVNDERAPLWKARRDEIFDSPAGLTRGSILFARGWMAGSSPAMTDF